jgi:hypothetical protein
LCVLGWFGHAFSPLSLSILTTGLMVVVAAWESISLRSGSSRSSSVRDEKIHSDATST